MNTDEKYIKDSWDDDDKVSIHYFIYEYVKNDENDK